MGDNKEVQEEYGKSSIREVFEHNQQEIIKKKEGYYDKIIDSLHLTKGKIDILIIILLAIIVLIFVFAHRN